MAQRNASRGKKGFIWLPRDYSITWKVEINGSEVTTDILTSEFMKGVCPEVGSFKIQLINADEKYSDLYSQNQLVKMYAGRTQVKKFEGYINKIEQKFDSGMGFITIISGIHLTHDLIDVKVTAKYDGDTSISDILDDLNDYLTGYTVSSTSTNTSKPKINWDEKALWDCIYDLVKIADADCYVSDSKVITFFDKNSVTNTDDAIVWNDTLIDLSGLGTQILTTKNKIRTYGDDGTGLPIIHTANNTTSQTDYGVKEDVVFDNKITTSEEAKEIADAELLQRSTPESEGETESLMLPTLNPGDNIYITNPTLKINGKYRLYKYTHKLPIERTVCVVGKERKMPQIIKRRIENELALTSLTNQYQMTGSLNYTYDNENDIASKDSNVSIANGKITLSSGTQGVITHNQSTQSSQITEVHLRAIGNNLIGTDFELSTDGGVTYETISLNNKSILTYPGTDVILKITIQSANTEIDSVAVLYK